MSYPLLIEKGLCSLKNSDVIKKFLNGATYGKSGNGNLRIEGNKLVNYRTTLAEFTEYGLIVNNTRYSVTTSKIQGNLRFQVSREGINSIEVEGVRMGADDLATHYEKTQTA